MAPRGRRSRRSSNRSEESRPLRPSSLLPFTSLPPYTEEQELDEQLATFKTTVRFQWKRRCIEALKKGKDLDELVDSKRRSASSRQYKSDVWNKL